MPPSQQNLAALLALATRLLKSGRPADAIAPLSQAAAKRPGDAAILHDLGVACLDADRLPDAIAALREATAANPRYTDAYFRLGIALERAGDAPAAIAAYDRATELLPGHTEAWFRAGALVHTLGHRSEAIGCFRRAAATGPKTSFGRLGAARALLAEDRDAEAEKILRRMLALDRANPMALDLLGNVLADGGRFDEARECFARAVELTPRMAGAYYDLVRCRRVTAADGDLPARMAAALATPGLDAEQRLRLHLAIGKAADDLGDHARAMHHFDAAEAERRAVAPFDAAAFDADISRLIERFPAALFGRPNHGAPGPRPAGALPVLILGMPRSGTTLVEQILSSHPQIAGAGELNFWNQRGVQDGAEEMSRQFLDQAAADYHALLRAMGPGAACVTDKMPFNFLWAGLIHLACPNATIIHCRRSAIDTALSIHRTLFNTRVPFPTGGRELVGYFRSYERLMAHWRSVLPADRLIELDYEKLTAGADVIIPGIVARLGLPWSAACLHPERNTRVVKTPSKWQARQAIYHTGPQSWRRYEDCLGPLRPLVEDSGPGPNTGP